MSDVKSSKDLGFEVSDTSFKPVFISGLSLFGLVVAGMIGMYFLFGFYENMSAAKNKPVSPLAQGRQLPDGPRLQVDPDMDWIIFDAKQDSILNSYGWISKEAGVVRVPIEKAIEISLNRGFPVRNTQGENK